MPTYEYECAACRHRFELFQSMSAEPEKKCPKCGKRKLARLIGSGGALIFKGSGFYVTDYRSEAYKKQAKSDSESAAPKAGAEASNAAPAAGAPAPEPKKDSSTAATPPKSSESKSAPKSKPKKKGD